MSYGLKYTTGFSSTAEEDYTLEIHFKDYVGSSTAVKCGSVPVSHSWAKDEMIAGIKGSSLEIVLINENGNLPLTSFFSVADDYALVKLFYGANLLFTGYIVQQDCKELLVDFTHEIVLTATDNLGLLKDITLGDAAVTFGTSVTYNTTITQLADNKIRVGGVYPLTNQVVKISSGTAIDGTYFVDYFQTFPVFTYTEITFKQNLNGTVVGSFVGDVIFITPVDLSGRMFLSEILALCLKSTGLQLTTNIYGRIFPYGTSNSRLLDGTKIDANSFLEGERWDSCYSVIEKIIGRFHGSLFQAEGVWNIACWLELRYNKALGIPGIEYDADFVYVQDFYLDNSFDFGIDETTKGLLGLESSIVRPFKFSRETLTYRNPGNILQNANLQDVSELLTSYLVGTDTYYEYRLKGWGNGYQWTSGGGGYLQSGSTNFIRVIKDADGNEIDRYMVAKGNPAPSEQTIQSNGIEVVAGDNIELSFDFKTNLSASGWRYFEVVLITTANPVPRNANNRWLNTDGRWRAYAAPAPPPQLIGIYVGTGDNYDQSHTITVKSDKIPFDGKLYVKLIQANSSPYASNAETQYKNFRFEVKHQIAGSLNVTGHQHTDQQLPIIKNNDEIEIFVDNTPSNAIAGTLFLHSFTGPVQDRTKTWFYQGNTYNQLGNATTKQFLFWRRLPRVKLEGGLVGLIQTKNVSMLTRMIYTEMAGLNFMFGSLDIDYRNNALKCTLYEVYKDTELEADLVEFYDYKYLFK